MGIYIKIDALVRYTKRTRDRKFITIPHRPYIWMWPNNLLFVKEYNKKSAKQNEEKAWGKIWKDPGTKL